MNKINKPKILVVDDESTHQLAIMDVIEAYEKDYDILSAFNGKEAFEITLKEHPDLIITDWEMPVMDGIAFIQELKKDKRLLDIPVIMCTGIMTNSKNLKEALEVGANDYIRKPIDGLELIARVNANLHLAEKHNEIKKLNEIKDKLFSVIAHDLRGPISAFKGLTDLMLKNVDKYPKEKLKEISSMLNKQCISVSVVLDNLLAWSMSQRNETKFHPLKQRLADVVDRDLALFEVLAHQKELVLQNNIPHDMTATFDLDLFSAVIRNLVNNAIKFSFEGGVITIEAEPGEHFHKITVADTGLGIKPEILDQLFDRNKHVTTFGTNSEKGTGLGLKLCQDFIEMHNGEIGVESELGKGSRFIFTIPV